jgi:hypothetical protein
MVEIPARLKDHYASLDELRKTMEIMRKNQELRGPENFEKRSAERAKKNTWRQMKGMQLFMHEVNHPGNKPFVIAAGIVSSVMVYLYVLGKNSEKAKQDSKYYQRFIAPREHH